MVDTRPTMILGPTDHLPKPQERVLDTRPTLLNIDEEPHTKVLDTRPTIIDHCSLGQKMLDTRPTIIIEPPTGGNAQIDTRPTMILEDSQELSFGTSNQSLNIEPVEVKNRDVSPRRGWGGKAENPWGAEKQSVSMF